MDKAANFDMSALLEIMPADTQQVIVGPGVWQPSDGLVSKRHYFILVFGTLEHNKTKMLQVDCDPEFKNACRDAAIAFLCTVRPPLVIHCCDSEWYMAKLCYGIWPTAKFKRVIKTMEKEREAFAPGTFS